MIKFFIFASIFIQVSSIKVGLIVSELTPSGLRFQVFSNLRGISKEVSNVLDLTEDIEIITEEVQVTADFWTLPQFIFDFEVNLILDVTDCPDYSQYLATQAVPYNFLHVVYSRSPNFTSGEFLTENTIFTKNSYSIEAFSLYSLVKTYGWDKVAVVHNGEPNSVQLTKALRDLVVSPITFISEIIVSEGSSGENLEKILASTIKYSSVRVIIVMASPTLASSILSAADECAIGGSGYVWILNAQAMVGIEKILKASNSDIAIDLLGVVKTGVIGILPEDSEYLHEEPLGNLYTVLTIFGQAIGALENFNGNSLYAYFMSNPATPSTPFPLYFDSDGMKKSNYLLYNLQEFTQVLVGNWTFPSEKFVINPDVVVNWPGLPALVPNNLYIPLNLVLLYASDSTSQDVENGFELGISEMNKKLIGYKLQSIYLETTTATNLVTGKMKPLENVSILGYIGPETTELVIAYEDYIAHSSSPKPIISTRAGSYLLNSTTLYPYLLRTIQPDGLQASALALFIQSQGWKEIGLIYSDDEVGVGIYQSFISNSASLEITMINDPNRRAIHVSFNEDGTLSKSTNSSIDDALSGLVEIQAKILIFLGNSQLSTKIAEVAYAKELYGSNFFWLGSKWLNAELLENVKNGEIYKNTKDKILTVLNGAMTLVSRGATGTLGDDFVKIYKDTYGIDYTHQALLAYDTVSLYYNSIESLIAQEEDFVNGENLMDTLRAADFQAASGNMKFSEGTNDRTVVGYGLENVQNNELILVKIYDPLEAFVDQENTTVVWGGGSSSPTDDVWGTSYDCPFPEIMVKANPTGVGIVVLIGVGLFLITLAISIYSYKRLKQEEVINITSKIPKTWKDTLVQVQIAIEFFQFIAIAPFFASLQQVIQVISNVFMLDIMKITNASKEYYWPLLSATCSLCIGWFLFMVIVIFKGEKWVNKIPICHKIVSLINTLFLPFFGNTMFLPVLALLLDVFVCDHKVLGKPFVWRDCYMTCWEPEHYKYISISVISIILYEPLAVITRPIWQKAKNGVHLKVQPLFLMIKTCIQILLITVGKVLQGNSPLAHGVIFSLLIIAFAALTYKFNSFNYRRCDLWETTSLILVFYLSVLATISASLDPMNIGWFIGLIIGWAIIIAVTYYLQYKYFPKLLLSARNKATKKVQGVYSMEHVGTLDRNKIERIKAEREKSNQVIDISNSHIEENRDRSPSSSLMDEESDAVPV